MPLPAVRVDVVPPVTVSDCSWCLVVVPVVDVDVNDEIPNVEDDAAALLALALPMLLTGLLFPLLQRPPPAEGECDISLPLPLPLPLPPVPMTLTRPDSDCCCRLLGTSSMVPSSSLTSQ